ncbi:MAG: type II secretion system F family protein [Candidatus Thiodiazotropha endolucinida]|uniref:Bacterial type II secretion system protein F domain protein n=2 Tax=Candidatus Thiodiazotropha TaxID=1913444 RepID=A0A7Z1AEN9_9GAMM|nr:type II secretion system F family protein [Candidatus Thiodiazotropha endolucinida]MBT3016704.1 type II secretion system F family protein [Candidatus Thiodiazotropha taylori]MBT3032267.1 type II secretion system F family protein [Candidatus Thiodiazotropha sp. (ex Lucina pensylvanica)]MBT3040518.1 type II secretion system F family protein [Candidatus Thiodiazotropha sp. (ex Codakia orbicularis)]MBT3043570.1 type II secretion system F family protein [Candidatus Thiodiazotropha sp. (ex Codakia
MDINFILAFVFVAISAAIWVLLGFSVHGYERYQSVFTEQTESKLENLFLFVDAKKMFLLNIASLLTLPVVIYFFTGSFFYIALAVLVLLVMPKLLLIRMEAKRKEKLIHALPDALTQIASGMSAGQTFISAVETMVNETKGPISQEFSLVLREQRLGMSLSEAMDNLAERVQAEELDLVVTATQIANDVGGNLSEIFRRLSDSLRRKMEMEGKIKALTSQGILQGWVVGLLPFFIIAALYFVDRENIAPIFTNLLGWIFLAIIIILEIIGGLMIRKIVNIDI